jgi:condensin complex subunit 2
MSFNDDAQEKLQRSKSRHAFAQMQKSRIKSALSPSKSFSSLQTSPSHYVENPGPITPMKRVPILAKFEEWMRIVTDNKVNTTNSWDFALIDYFHDMSLFREGDGVNFQRASCTLDGCVKIYTTRIDSMDVESKRLLSGLIDSVPKKVETSARRPVSSPFFLFSKPKPDCWSLGFEESFLPN